MIEEVYMKNRFHSNCKYCSNEVELGEDCCSDCFSSEDVMFEDIYWSNSVEIDYYPYWEHDSYKDEDKDKLN
jgi:hypothetical protein